MLLVLLTVLAVFVLLVIAELWWRKQAIHGEFSRKFVHVTVGSFVAFWPFYLSWHKIEILSLAFLIIVAASKYLHLFRAIHSVQRPTWGELFFAAAVGLVALVTHNEWIYAAALLQMSLADGLAAVVGVRYGNRIRYLVFGHIKSVVGTLTFFIVSFVILLVINHYGKLSLDFGYALLISVLAGILENLAAVGLDNLLVPLLVALMLVNR